jgi:hypothetical protein
MLSTAHRTDFNIVKMKLEEMLKGVAGKAEKVINSRLKLRKTLPFADTISRLPPLWHGYYISVKNVKPIYRILKWIARETRPFLLLSADQ